MLGYDVSWAAFNIVEVMSSSKFTYKVWRQNNKFLEIPLSEHINQYKCQNPLLSRALESWRCPMLVMIEDAKEKD